MGKFYDNVVVYNWPWDRVAQAFWLRYPNPFSRHVLTEDILLRRIRADRCLYTRRLLTKTNVVPRWGERFLGSSSHGVCIVEESLVDPVANTITTYTRNIALKHIMSVEEMCTFRVHPENAKLTLCERRAWISSSVFGFRSAIQSFGLERFKKNSQKSVLGFQYVLESLFGQSTAISSVASNSSLKKAIQMAQAAKLKTSSPIITGRQPS